MEWGHFPVLPFAEGKKRHMTCSGISPHRRFRFFPSCVVRPPLPELRSKADTRSIGCRNSLVETSLGPFYRQYLVFSYMLSRDSFLGGRDVGMSVGSFPSPTRRGAAILFLLVISVAIRLICNRLDLFYFGRFSSIHSLLHLLLTRRFLPPPSNCYPGRPPDRRRCPADDPLHGLADP